MEKDLSIYVHIPFCVRKCNYCDFLSFHAKKDVIEDYFAALKREIVEWGKELRDADKKTDALADKGPGPDKYKVRSIFFGGGTPSFVEAKSICDTLSAIRSSFDVAEDAEISIEVNPASAMQEKLMAYRRAGFNRIRIGAQSLNDEELKVLGRVHNSRMFFDTFRNARGTGFDNINVDIMSALPGQSLSSYLDSLQRVLELGPEHISAYSLIIEEGTPFFDMELDLPDEEADREMYHRTKELLSKAGYHRYEISNYAKASYECCHNKVYWKRGSYLGVGLGASSMVDNVRWSNIRDIDEYIRAFDHRGRCGKAGNITGAEKDAFALDTVRCDVEYLSQKSQMEEFMFLGLRLVEGVDASEFRRQFGTDIKKVYGSVIHKYVDMALLEYEGDHLRLTEKGLDVSNTVMADFLL